MIQVAAVVTRFDEHGHIVAQRTAQPVTVYRATTPDVWTHLATLLARTTIEPGDGT